MKFSCSMMEYLCVKGEVTGCRGEEREDYLRSTIQSFGEFWKEVCAGRLERKVSGVI